MSEPTDQRLLATMKQVLLYHPLSVFPGRCYFALLPDGTIKIGYSNTVDLMHHRMKMLSRQYGADVLRLADLPGGFITEALMHERFAADRIPGTGERFQPSAELMHFIGALRANAPTNAVSPYQDLVPDGQMFDVVDQGPPAVVLVDHHGRPPEAAPSQYVDRSWCLDLTPLPDDIVTYEGKGKSALNDLARLMRHAADDETGLSLADAKRELLLLKNLDLTERHNRWAVQRAWGALIDLSRICPADGVNADAGRSVWVKRDGDPS